MLHDKLVTSVSLLK